MGDPNGIVALAICGGLLVLVLEALGRMVPSWLIRLVRHAAPLLIVGVTLTLLASASSTTRVVILSVWVLAGGISRHVRNSGERQRRAEQHLLQLQQPRRRVPPPPPTISSGGSAP